MYWTLRKYISFGFLKRLLSHPQLLIRMPGYIQQMQIYRAMELAYNSQKTALRIYPCLEDSLPSQSVGHYFYQDSWAAKQVFKVRPEMVVDIGSTVLLVGILSQFTPCISVDIRPVLTTNFAGMTSVAGSITEFPFGDNTIPCLTTMCVLEHIGLGRYGDPLNPNGTLDAVAEIARVIRPGGMVVFSVPVGREVTEFNAGRRFRYQQAASFFQGWQLLDSCVLTPSPVAYTSDEMFDQMTDPVGCFCFRKPEIVT